MTQYRKELWRIIKSLIFLFMAAGLVLFAYSQNLIPPDTDLRKPAPNGYYGLKASNDPALIMPEAAESLFTQYTANKYITYPNGFYKAVKLNQADRRKMAGIIAELSMNENSEISQADGNTGTSQAIDSNGSLQTGDNTGISQSTDSESSQAAGKNLTLQVYGNDAALQVSGGKTETASDGIQINGESLQANEDGNFQIIVPERKEAAEHSDFQLNPHITWDRFKALMIRADQLLGGGSDFSESWLAHRFGRIPVTYEEALADYELILSQDKVTGSYARLFSDYMGIMLGLLPVFPAVFICLSDRRKIAPMLYTRRISSARFILMRFFALVTAAMKPVLLMGAVLTGILGRDFGLANIDVFAYLKYTFFWLLPTAMAAIAVGLFFTTLSSTPIAIAVQLVWWFIDMRGGMGSYSFFGARPLQLMPRHNDLGKVEAYKNYLPSLIQNRILIVFIAFVLLAGSIYVFSARRRGWLYVPGFKRGKIQSAL